MRINFKILSSLILGLNIYTMASACDPSPEKIQLTPLRTRIEVIGQYYQDNINNTDNTVFDHLKKWHSEDVNAIKNKIKSPKNIDLMNQYFTIMSQVFAEGRASYAKLALAYMLYSYVLSDEIDPAQIDYIDGEREGRGEEIKEIISYISQDIVPLAALEEANVISYGLDSINVIKACNAGIRCLPYVSGIAGYRSTNESFGLRTPVLLMPLHRDSYDGTVEAPPSGVYSHDVNHMGMEIFNGFSLSEIMQRYDLYRIFNNKVRLIADKKTQFICDFFLTQLGHEDSFNAESLLKFSSTVPLLMTAETYHADLSYIIEKKITKLEEFTKTYSIDFYWTSIRSDVASRNNIPASPNPWDVSEQEKSVKDKYYLKESPLRHFLNPDNPGRLYSFVEVVNKLGLPKNTYLNIEALEKALKVQLWQGKRPINEVGGFDGIPEDGEITMWWRSSAGGAPYFELIQLEAPFQKRGIDFKVWNGDKINVESLTAFYKQALETFKKEVGSPF